MLVEKRENSFKRLLLVVLFLGLSLVLALAFSKGQASAEDDTIGAKDGEADVSFVDPDTGEIDKEIEYPLDIDEVINSGEFETETDFETNVTYTYFWRIASKTQQANTYGSWNDCAHSQNGGTLSCSSSWTRSHSYTGTLKVAKSAVDASVGFNITSSRTITAGTSDKVKARTKIQYRYVYNNYKVKQDQVRYNMNNGSQKVVDTKYVYPRKYAGVEFRYVSY